MIVRSVGSSYKVDNDFMALVMSAIRPLSKAMDFA